MSELSSVPHARLVTAFGTLLYVDISSGELRHGAEESSPANAFFVANQSAPGPYRRGILVRESGQSRTPIVRRESGSHSVLRAEDVYSKAPSLFELIPLERGLIALRAGDFFLSATPDGRVGLSTRCSSWELFLASEDWCSEALDADDAQVANDASFDRKGIANYIVHPMLRMRANTKPKAKKILVYGYTKWSHGRVYYDLCTHLHRHGYVVDILDWQVDHTEYISKIIPYYDLFMTALDGVIQLIRYGIPYDKIIAISHHEFDIRMLIEQKGLAVFNKFANYGVVSEYVYCASLMRGVQRIPKVVPLGVNYSEFHAEISKQLTTVGFASSMSVETYGVEWKRGRLAEAAARDAGLKFSVAGSTGNQTSFHDMPDFYRTVDAVLVSSLSEAAQLPVMEAAAAGRLVIGTPVGHFPLKAYQGGGILAPIEAEKFKSFTAATLRYYSENPTAYVDKCRAIQEAARQFDWQYSIDAWVELIAAAGARGDASSKDAARRSDPPISIQPSTTASVVTERIAQEPSTRRARIWKKGIVCDIGWLSGFICQENYYFIKQLQSAHGFDILDSKATEFRAADIVTKLNNYDALLISYQGWVDIPWDQVSSYKIFRVDDLVSYNDEFDKYLNRMVSGSDMIISPYAYAFREHFEHSNVVWLPFSAAKEAYRKIDFNEDPIGKVLVSGSLAADRPFRQYAATLESKNVDVLPHPGYGRRYDGKSDDAVGEKYLRELNRYLCCFSDAHAYRYMHVRNFEIASIGSLLLADKLIEREMNELGFIDRDTCVFATKETLPDTISWICDHEHRADVDRIRRAGMELVRERHLTRHRAKELNDIVDNAIGFGVQRR